jgi:hypothetical protein
MADLEPASGRNTLMPDETFGYAYVLTVRIDRPMSPQELAEFALFVSPQLALGHGHGDFRMPDGTSAEWQFDERKKQ